MPKQLLPLLILLLFSYTTIQAQEDSEEAYIKCELMPSFEECADLLDYERDRCTETVIFKFIAENTQYPQEAKEADLEGTVYVQFNVDTEGEVVDATVIRGVYGSLDQEALRVINALPKFIPGKQQGKAVKVRYVIPVRFVLN